MLLMEGRNVLDVQVFNGRQKLSLEPFFFCGFLRVLFLFALSYLPGAKKHMLFNKFL